jgi:hypothetical protein
MDRDVWIWMGEKSRTRWALKSRQYVISKAVDTQEPKSDRRHGRHGCHADKGHGQGSMQLVAESQDACRSRNAKKK